MPVSPRQPVPPATRAASFVMLLALGAALGMMARGGRAAEGSGGLPEARLGVPRVRPSSLPVSMPTRIAAPDATESAPAGPQPVRIAPPQQRQPTRLPPSTRPEPVPAVEPASEPAGSSESASPRRDAAENVAAQNEAAQRQPTNEEQATDQPPLRWWQPGVAEAMLDRPRWVTFDLQTILIDTLRHSPKVQGVSREASVALERIVQQDAEFDPKFLLESGYGLTNDPVGNSLVTGGPPRLREESFSVVGGVKRKGRSGTVIDLSQEMGLLDSNSNFFQPADQGNARLSLSLTQPLFAGRGRVYNERLLTQARIDSQMSWQEMRDEVEARIADVMIAYWRLYQYRCQLLQQTELLERGRRIERIIQARSGLDAGQIETSKIRQRVARRYDQWLQYASQVQQQESRLKALVGSETLLNPDQSLELIPVAPADYPALDLNLRDAVLRGIENRPDVRATAAELESAALSVQVTRNELLPQISAVVDSYLAGLNGSSAAFNSFADQFTESGPGVAASLQFDLPRGRRASRSRHREALHRFHQKNEELRESVAQTRMEIETALIRVETAAALRRSNERTLHAAIAEENAVTRRWEMLAADGGTVGTVLEDLLETQQRRTDAERTWVTAGTDYLVALVELQRAMGTLLIHKGIEPTRSGNSSVEFHHLPSGGGQPDPNTPDILPSNEGKQP